MPSTRSSTSSPSFSPLLYVLRLTVMRPIAVALFVFANLGVLVFGQCTRKLGKAPEVELDAKPPAQLPPDHFVQSTFIYRLVTDEDAEYASNVAQKIGELREHLKIRARLSIDNENIDCTMNEVRRCAEFPAKGAFHFLVVEDSSHGAAIYSIDRKLNEESEEKIEMALLDVFSRHSKVPLMDLGSAKADKILGFVRELSIEEIQEFQTENKQKKAKKPSKHFFGSRSPFELDLIEPHILEFRMANFGKDEFSALKALNKEEFRKTIDENQFVFVHFWTNAQISSIHAHHLWAKAAEKAQNPKVVFASVACHEVDNFCIDEGIGNIEDYYSIVAFKNGERYAVTRNIKDEDYYVNWVKMLTSGPIIEVNTEEDLKEARRGRISGFEEVRPAVTVAVFASKESAEFTHFENAAEILNGRYHFVVFINEKAEKPMISTFRPTEKTKRTDYSGMFDPKSIIEHVTSSSMPSLIDISKGFTPDLIRSAFETILLIHSNSGNAAEYVEYASKNKNKNTIFMILNRASSDVLPLNAFLEKLNPPTLKEPVLVIYKRNAFRMAAVDQRPLSIQINELEDLEPPQLMLKPSDVNPFKHLHSEAINTIFGRQEVMLLPDPVVSDSAHSHGLEGLDFGEAAASGGCPMMAQMNQMRDEL